MVLLGGIMGWIYVIFSCIKEATHGEFALREAWPVLLERVVAKLHHHFGFGATHDADRRDEWTKTMVE